MRYKKIASIASAVLLGLALGIFVKYAYWKLNLFPMTDLFMGIVTSPVGTFVIKNTSSQSAVFLAIAMKALPWSIAAGAAAGIVLHKIKYQRLFCYSALVLPLATLLVAYYSYLAFSAPTPEFNEARVQYFGRHMQENVAIYSWYFLALFVSFAIVKRVAHNKPVNPDAPTSGAPVT